MPLQPEAYVIAGGVATAVATPLISAITALWRRNGQLMQWQRDSSIEGTKAAAAVVVQLAAARDRDQEIYWLLREIYYRENPGGRLPAYRPGPFDVPPASSG